MNNKTIQVLIEAINLIPRQFYFNASHDKNTNISYERFVSQLTIRHRKLTGSFCRTEQFLPSSEVIQKFASTPEKIAMIRKLALGLSSVNEHKPSLFFDQAVNLPLTQVTMIELKTDCKLQRAIFYWDFFKLHYFVEQNRNSYGIYFIVNQDVDSVKKKIEAYYKRGFHSSLRVENIFFLIKKGYDSDIVVLDYKGESII